MNNIKDERYIYQPLRKTLPKAGDIFYFSLTSRRWPGGIVPYEFSSYADRRTKYVFNRAISTIQKYSCVQFVHRRFERDYVRVITGDGCYSMIGRQRGRQYLSLGKGCYRKGMKRFLI